MHKHRQKNEYQKAIGKRKQCPTNIRLLVSGKTDGRKIWRGWNPIGFDRHRVPHASLLPHRVSAAMEETITAGKGYLVLYTAACLSCMFSPLPLTLSSPPLVIPGRTIHQQGHCGQSNTTSPGASGGSSTNHTPPPPILFPPPSL